MFNRKWIVGVVCVVVLVVLMFVCVEVCVFFVELQDGVMVLSFVYVKFGFEGMVFKLVGDMILDIGYYYLLIDGKLVLKGDVILVIDYLLYFGKVQIEIDVKLLFGQYMLMLQFGDGVYCLYGFELSLMIMINVK